MSSSRAMGSPLISSLVLLIIAVSLVSALPEYRRIGCFGDARNKRAFSKRLGHVGSQPDPQLACYKLAKAEGYTVFGLQYGGECWSGPDAPTTYGIHGQSSRCSNNLGGGWANDVFVKAYYHVGCFRDNTYRSMRSYLGTFSGPDSAQKCYEKVASRGFHAFGLQNDGECWSSEAADVKFNMHGPSDKCRNGKGGGWANDIYFLHNYSPLYKSHGCYNDQQERAMGSRQETRRNRNDSIELCYKDAIRNGYKMFGLQYGGECWSGKDIELTYSKYGEVGNCKDGLGGGWSNNVYSINFFRKGCYLDLSPKAMTEFLGHFTGPNAVMQCYWLVKGKNYQAFGVQNGGDCYTSRDAEITYDKYGAGSGCKDGTGSTTSNDVYFMTDFDPYNRVYPRVGCFKDTRSRALPVHLGDFSKDTINRCFKLVLDKEWRYFGIQHGQECWSGPNSAATYNKHGVGSGCYNGLGGSWHNDVYRIALQYKGCFKDDPLRALPDVLGIWPKIQPSVALGNCFAAAKAKKLQVFGIQYDGECYSSPKGTSVYKKYGSGSGCTNGVGASWVNDVYYVNSTSRYTSLGCWKDEAWRRFELLGTWREDSYLKCFEATTAKGYKGFGLQYGGECWSSSEIETRYNERGSENTCKDGKGSDWANDIYLI